ncbi:MAG: 1-phosphofructokinase family hexose kinase [Enterococcus aquimarinus]
MIISLTLNPSVDYLYEIDSFQLGKLNRFKNPVRMVGGKGINAGRTASILGSKVWATGVLAGKNGELVRSILEKEKFSKDFLDIDGETRNAITIMHNNGIQTEMIEVGPYVNETTEEEILKKIIQQNNISTNIEVICLCGSVNSKNENLYQNFIKIIKKKLGNDIKILADISRTQLKNVLESDYKPYFIKPNIHEFSEIIDTVVNTKDEIVYHLKNSNLFDGVPLIIVSCGEDGAIAKFNKEIYDLKIPTIDLVNPTGSGDATVGGVAYALDNKLTTEEILRYAMASGVANAMEEAVGFVDKKNVEDIKNKIIIKKLIGGI